MQSSDKNNFDLSSLKVGFILPAFNEYENIFILLKQIESIFNNKSIIIIDDSTNDSIKNKISSRNDILYIKRESRLGRGSEHAKWNSANTSVLTETKNKDEHILTVESTGSLDAKNIVLIGMDELSTRLVKFKEMLSDLKTK